MTDALEDGFGILCCGTTGTPEARLVFGAGAELGSGLEVSDWTGSWPGDECRPGFCGNTDCLNSLELIVSSDASRERSCLCS